MNKEDIISIAMQKILHYMDEGIHIIDGDGITILYNEAMEEIEGLEAKQVMGKHILDVFPSLTRETSTLLKALYTGEIVKKYRQSYLNLKGKKISSINTTIPIIKDHKTIGAVEIAMNVTNVSHLSEQIIKLQEKLSKPLKEQEVSKKRYTFDNIIGNNKSLLKAIYYAKRASKTPSSVLIYGETGTGKELFAQSIHYESERKNNQFIAQNCAALPESLLEGILFGTSKGSFTGAIDRPGLFEQANGGTLFLDELNSMGLPLQAKLLRVLQEGYIRRVGGLKDIHIDVKIIAATNEDPLEAIKRGDLRKDLYYRINVINIRIPPLRERKEDIKLLVDHFIKYYNKLLKKDIWMISEELIEAFMNYTWPGNVRELQNYIESAMNIIDEDHVIKREHLPSHFETALLDSFNMDRDIDFEKIEKLDKYLEGIEKRIIAKCLSKNRNNITKTSRELGVSRQRLQYKIKKYGIEK